MKIIVIGLLVLTTAAFFAVNIYLNRINRDTKKERINPAEEYFETDENAEGDNLDPDDVVWSDGDESVLRDKNIINIMLIGQDTRDEYRGRSDSMILATINKRDKTVMLTSFMRDLYVQIPGYSDNRLNASYAFGGMELLDNTIAKNFRIHIDGNAEVDFNGFVNLVDKADGIDILINDDEAAFLGLKESGLIHMDGDTALAYSRIRYVGRDDFERTERQRNILVAAFEKAKDMGLLKIISLVNELLPYVTTDMTNIEIINLATIIMNMSIEKLETYRIPDDQAFTPAIINNMQVLVPDLEKCRQMLKDNLGYKFQ